VSPGFRHQRELQSREIAQAHPLCALLDRTRHGGIGQLGQDAREAIAAPRDQRDIGTAGRRTGQRGHTGGVVARKTLNAEQRRGVDFDLVALGAQAFESAAKTRGVSYRARRGIEVDVGHAPIVRENAGSTRSARPHQRRDAVALVWVRRVSPFARPSR
jgi:hypothetical protein